MTTRISAHDLDFGQHHGADVVVVGAGLIGLAIALELQARGAAVTVLERGMAVSGASIAAAGMLAVGDPHNPTALLPFSMLSAEQYPAFLRRIEDLSGLHVPFQTEEALQYMADGSRRALQERSLDPRQLTDALLAAMRSTQIRLLENTWVASERKITGGFELLTNTGESITCARIVYAAGAWTKEAAAGSGGRGLPTFPRKGQMLRVRVPREMNLREVHRSEKIYIVPRVSGPQAGTALIGATVEDAGFDTEVRAAALSGLRGLAGEIFPELRDEVAAPQVEAWAGLRPATPDSLPMIGGLGDSGRFVASGHYRNGVLLTPGTAQVVADLIEGKCPAIDVSGFAPMRFESTDCVGESPDRSTDIRPAADDNRSFRL
jgi:glycine oxidase